MQQASSSSSSSYPSWDSLPADLTELLLEFLESFFDRVRFGAVCKSWKDAAAAFHARPARCRVPSLPILTFRDPKQVRNWGKLEAADPREEGTAEEEVVSPITRCFYSLAEDKVYRLQVPCEPTYWRCFGSSHGWLSMVDLCVKPFLFNPITGARVDLPSLVTLTSHPAY
uniref:F-box protein At1g49360 n=1 Tax=Anthurium amnicola TaxID=1678845 RepID=A0A1D1YUQ6_9ARAE